ncbi:MAG TPA: fused MFS/spermidine synthase, partial [Vicinamibacterales bacterium]|nr:fused MFS/spermidine synthase [Vicinamibacterales bacterium]
ARDVAASTNFETLFLRQTLTIALVLLPASVCLGATFSLALAVASPETDETARDAGRIYVANTIGAVTGALTAGFVLVPRFGLQGTFLLASIVLFAGGLAIAAFAVGRPEGRHYDWRDGLQTSRWMLAALAALIAATTVFGWRPWDRDLITSGAYKYARQTAAEDLEWTLRAGRLEYYREGAAGTVSVRRLAGARALALDGKVDASNGGDMLTQRLLGLLPTLMHPEPRDALVIGLGTGVTADAVLASREVRHLDIVEISPEVIEASAYFTRDNHDVLKKPGVRLLIGDGRSHLRLSARQYDIIISEPSNPWMSGVATLFTREFFEAARARLRPLGIFCQWTQTYEIAEADLKSIVRTFASVFPDGTMWLAGEGDLLLIGSIEGDIGERITALPARSRAAAMRTLLADLGMAPDTAPFVLLSSYAGGASELARFGNGARVQTDDRTPLEFSAARAMFAPPPGNAERLRATAANAALPPQPAAIVRNGGADEWTARGTVALRAEAFGVAHDSFRRAVSIDSRSSRALRGTTDAAAGVHRTAEQVEWLKTLAAAEPGNAPVRVELSHALAALGDADGAIAAVMDAKRIAPDSPEPLEQLASILADVGDGARLRAAADELASRFPARQEGRYYQAAALFLVQRPADAERTLKVLLSGDPRHAKGHNLLGVICASRRDLDCARAAFTRALDLNPRDPSMYVNLGYLNLDAGDPVAAIGLFREALAVDPADDAARRGLADAHAAQER